ncbi:hypothetical protein Hanom_Chr14g01308431 [Helianthus anomalus]
MVMHIVVVTFALGGSTEKKKLDFLTIHPKVFHKLLLTQIYLFFFTSNTKLFIFCNLPSQLFLLSTLLLNSFHFSTNFSLYASF